MADGQYEYEFSVGDGDAPAVRKAPICPDCGAYKTPSGTEQDYPGAYVWVFWECLHCDPVEAVQ